MNLMNTLLLVVAAGAVAAPTAAQDPGRVHEAPAELFDAPPVRRAELPAPLRRQHPALADLRDRVTNLGPIPAAQLELSRLEDLVVSGGPPRIGLVREVGGRDLRIDSRATIRRELGDGRAVWSLSIRSVGARRVRLHFVDLDLDGTAMTVFGETAARTIVRGPWHDQGRGGEGDLWTSSVPGELIHVEIVGDAAARPRGRIVEVAHIDRDPADLLVEDGGTNGDDVFPCHVDASCATMNMAARKATGRMSFVSGGNVAVCTGTLLQDLDGMTSMPYFITAAHCVNTQSEVASLEVIWNFERYSCGGFLPDPDDLPRNEGGTLLVTNSENDMSFIRLDGGLVADAVAGWTTETSLDNAFGVHHPGGSFKRWVALDSVGFCPGCLCLDGDDFDYYSMDQGLVEGGSSGSGVFNGNGQLAGQLYGRCSEFSDPEDMDCSNIDSYWAVYGEFESTWQDTQVSFWLTLGGTIHVDNAPPPPCQNGLPGCPFDTIQEANALAWKDVRIEIHAGNYPEAITITKDVKIVPVGGMVTIGQ